MKIIHELATHVDAGRDDKDQTGRDLGGPNDPSEESIELVTDWIAGKLSVPCRTELLSDEEWEAASPEDRNA